MEFIQPETRQSKIQKILIENNSPSYTLNQINEAIYQKGVKTFDEITNISKDLRQQLKATLGEVSTLKLVNQIDDSQVQKFLFETRDGEKIEAVRMMYKPTIIRTRDHNALCISSQSGCGMGCKFCATGAIGFKKNLTRDEIVDQFLYFRQNNINIDSIFCSGMGEPLVNQEFFEALKELTDVKLVNLGSRKISVSTVGIVPGIERLTKEFPQINLAFSLHSPFPAQRLELMPITKTYPMADVLKAVEKHIEETHRKVFIAYIVLGGVNDSKEHANALAKLLKGIKNNYLLHVNLIKYHSGPSEILYNTPQEKMVSNFQEILNRFNIKNTVRQSFGLGIDAACGQLYAKYEKRNKPLRR